MRKLLIVMFLAVLPPIYAQEDPAALLLVATWNVESGEADPNVIARQMTAFEGVDLWGLTEVESEADARIFQAAAEDGRGADFGAILSESGDEDRLLVLYNTERFQLIDADELDYINRGGRVRAPLVALLYDRQTETELAFMVNHLKARTDPASLRQRARQAEELNLWAADAVELGLPVIAVGDYNFYYEVDNSGYDPGLDAMEADGVFEWIEPIDLVSTQCTADRDGCRFNSVVDFIFAAGPAQDWGGISEIIVTEGDFPDDDTTSDHRPVLAVFEIDG